MTRRWLIVLLCLFPFAALPAHAREGFGFTKKSVSMMRLLPPLIDTSARRVRVDVKSDRSANADDAETLARYLEEAILSGGGTLDADQPELTLAVSIARLDSHESWETRTVSERRKTGTRRVWNEKRQRYENEDVYSDVDVVKNVKVVSCSLTGAYDISAKRDDLDSGDIDESFEEKYDDGTSSPAPSRVEDDLLRRASQRVASRVVPTKDRVLVLVPKGSFESLIPLAESGAWDRYLAGVEAVAANRNAREEAYRQYALAIAKEALAYSAPDRDGTLAQLGESIAHYRAAIAGNASEELFQKGYESLFSSGAIGAPLNRASESAQRFTSWTAGSRTVSRPATPKSAAKTPSKTPAKAAGSSPTTTTSAATMRNQTVIEMAKAGLSDEILLRAIDEAPRTDFDVSPDGLIALARGGVSKPVIAHMQKTKKR